MKDTKFFGRVLDRFQSEKIFINSRKFPFSSKGHSSAVSLMTTFVSHRLNWEDYYGFPDELHLTQVEHEIIQLNEKSDELKIDLSPENVPTGHTPFDQKILCLFDIDFERVKHFANEYQILVFFSSQFIDSSKLADLFNDSYFLHNFSGDYDISDVEDLRFWVNERL